MGQYSDLKKRKCQNASMKYDLETRRKQINDNKSENKKKLKQKSLNSNSSRQGSSSRKCFVSVSSCVGLTVDCTFLAVNDIMVYLPNVRHDLSVEINVEVEADWVIYRNKEKLWRYKGLSKRRKKCTP